jgi:hypothetical protein
MAYAEINAWNNLPTKQKIRALILYRWPKYDPWYIDGKLGVYADFQAAVKQRYIWQVTEPDLPRMWTKAQILTLIADALK